MGDRESWRLSTKTATGIVKECAQRADIRKRITPHALRHTFASHLVMRGAAMKAVQELLGHATMEMTNRYSHLSPEVPRHAVKLLDGLDPVTNPSGRQGPLTSLTRPRSRCSRSIRRMGS